MFILGDECVSSFSDNENNSRSNNMVVKDLDIKLMKQVCCSEADSHPPDH